MTRAPNKLPATLSVTYYQQLAAHFSEIIDETAAIIPRSSSPGVSTNLNNIPLKFLGTTVASFEQESELQKIGTLDVNRGRDTLQLIDAFRPVLVKMTAFMKDLGNELTSRHASLAAEVLVSYEVAKRLARKTKSPSLAAWVANMQRDFGRRGLKPKKTEPDKVTADPRGHAVEA